MGFIFSKDMAEDRYRHEREMRRFKNEYEIAVSKQKNELSEAQIRERIAREKQEMQYRHEKEMLEMQTKSIIRIIDICHQKGLNPFENTAGTMAMWLNIGGGRAIGGNSSKHLALGYK
uniref:uncharacterized protein LOC120342693 n=1 Tax=Styela clava TaxID=7725 RepID=UPI0019396EB1|nr:uncharacterized protein LOC120342693 [Styela clava]XP_039267665.1 uncharacterized protein LOC120342767 [Styela clava]XP_039267983.1 uncharacterized protein LOC120342987 [Styela clava]